MKPVDYVERVRAKLESLEPATGCYLFKDAAGEVVYVGKAKSLRSRVRSYFAGASSDERYFIPLLRGLVADVETVVTQSEKEAAVLENELIKRHQPRFNVKLRDDKDFLCLRLDLRKDWPRLETMRRPQPDGARYFGPYHTATSARRTLHLVNKHFQLRTCTDADMRGRKRPCLQFQIKRCAAPCVYDVDRGWYAEQAHAVELFLDARHDELSGELEQRMHAASQAMRYEVAALYRDQLRAVEAVRQEQRVVAVKDVDQDVFGLYRESELAEAVVLLVRQGHVTDSQSFSLRSELPDEEVLAGFLSQYYEARAGTLPDELVLSLRPDAVQGLADWLSERRGRKVKVVVPKSGARAELVGLARDNAQHAFREKQRAASEIDARLEQLQATLRLPSLPRAIECCDISHLGGGDAVGAVVALRDGRPEKKRYRSFKVRTTSDGDDYAAIYEVLARRFRRGRDDEGWELPDLLVVDGGRGQLAVALAAARDLGLHDLSVVGLAKERETALGEKLVNRVYLPGQKNGIPVRSGALHLLALARDEAHRFANRGRKKVGQERTLRSELDQVKGLGAAVRKALLRDVGSMQAIREANDERLLAVEGMTKRHLAALRKAIGSPTGDAR